MINDEISNRAANIEVHVAKATLKEILKQIKRLHAKAKEHGGLDNLIKHEGKEMKLKDRLPEMSGDEQLKLLATNGMLVKRPLIVDGSTVITGFKEKEWSEHFL